MTTWSTTRIGNEGNRLVSEGKLFKAQLHAREARFFASTTLRDAFVATHSPTMTKKWRRGLSWTAAGHAPWAPDAPMGPRSPDFKFTACPSHPPRFAAHTFAHLHGGGRGMNG